MMVVPPGHLRALLERPRDQALIDAANELLAGLIQRKPCYPIGRTRLGRRANSPSTRHLEQLRSGTVRDGEMAKTCRRF